MKISNNDNLVDYLKTHPDIKSEEFNQALIKLLDNYEKKDKRINKILSQGDTQQKQVLQLNQNLDSLLETFDTYVIASRTDLKGTITYTSKAYEVISGYSKEELIGHSHSILRHPDMPSEIFDDMWESIRAQKIWIGEVKNLKKDGGYYWVKAFITPQYNMDDRHIGYSAIRLDITSQKHAEKLHKEVNNLLNNAGQGFLSFDKSLKIKKSFSKECLNIFKCNDIYEKDISILLFENDIVKKNLFIDGCQRVVSCENKIIKDMFLSLLPKTHNIHNIDISIEYKLLEDDKFMLIITNITEKIILEKELAYQHKIQKMIISAASYKNDFLEVVEEFRDFLSTPPTQKIVFLRELHTFKGIFSQKEMVHLPISIHKLETTLHNIEVENNSFIDLIDNADLENTLEKDIALISTVLGDKFFKETKKLSINKESIIHLELELKNLQDTKNFDLIPQLLERIRKFKYESIFDMLNIYPIAVKQMGQKLNKEIYPMQIVGDETLKVPTFVKPFVNSLIHVFNNCVEHGIEDIETRVVNQKDEIGQVNCSFDKQNDNLIIIISDDGSGIDTNTIRDVAIAKRLTTKEKFEMISEDEKLQYIFLDKFSTSQNVTITSGRGVGMSSVKYELEKLNGKLNIINKIGNGISFEFIISLKRGE